MGKIKRSKRNDSFTIINNEILKRSDLTWKAKGILCYLLSLPDDWEVYKTELPNHSRDGYDSTVTGFNELVKLGYITERRTRKEDGSFDGMDYEVFDIPQMILLINVSPIRDFPESGSPESGFPISGFPDLISIDNTKNSLIKKENQIKFILPTPDQDLDNLKKELKLNQIYLERVCMQSSIKMDFCFFLLDKFFLEMEIQEELRKDRRDAQSHFNRWVRNHKNKYLNDYRESQENKLSDCKTVNKGGAIF